MRILQLGPVPPPHGGVQANMSAIAKRLRQLGHECSLIAITRSEKLENETHVFHPRSIGQLLALLFKLQADVVHLHIGGDFSWRLAALAFICGVLPNKKSVLTFHSGGFASSSVGKAARRFSWRGLAARRLNKVIAVNHEIVRLFERYGVKLEKIALVAPHVLREPDPSVEIPINLRAFIQEHSPLLLTASWLEPHYDVKLQIRALEVLRNEFPNIGLLVAGSGYQELELKKFAAQSSCSEHVLLAGDVKHEVVLHLIKRADVLLRTTHFDGDAISVREALYLGTPVVATDNGMRPANVRLFKIGDLSGLIQAAAEQLKEGKPLRVQNGSDGWKNIDAVLQIYAELLKLPKVSQEIAMNNSQITATQNSHSEIRN